MNDIIKNKFNYIKNKILIILFIIVNIAYVVPSIIYYIKNKTILNFEVYFKYLLTDSINRNTQTLIYIIILTILSILYIEIIKKRKEIFKNVKQIFIFIAIISAIFIVAIPFTCSDVFYYLGIGRIDSKYGQNPYYTTIKQFVEDENWQYLEQDTVLKQGYINDWADSTVVYGPIWTIICKMIALMSFGNIDVGLFVFKILNIIVHLINCYIIYKISGKKIYLLLYGINPFIFIEAIASVHNDIFMILFILLSLYFLIKKKRIVASILFLSIATAIKYFAVILLPFIIIYNFKDEKPSIRLIKCIKYGMLFFIITLLPYLFYIKDLQVFSGLFIQQQKLAKSFYIIITEYFNNIPGLPGKVNSFLLKCFIIIYFFVCVALINKKQITFRKTMQNAEYFIIAFLFLLITNFQPWYIMWLFPCFMWQKTDTIKFIMIVSLVSQFANSIFLNYGEGWKYGTPFTFVLYTATLSILLFVTKRRKIVKS